MRAVTRGDARQFAAFLAVGVASAVVDGGTFLFLHHLGLVAWLANTIGYALSFGVNYQGNRRIVFKAGALPGAPLRYGLLVGFNWLVSTGLVHLGLLAGLAPWLAKGLSMAVVALVNFVALRQWVFKARQPKAPVQ